MIASTLFLQRCFLSCYIHSSADLMERILTSVKHMVREIPRVLLIALFLCRQVSYLFFSVERSDRLLLITLTGTGYIFR